MTEWRDCKFGEIATFSYGKMPNKKILLIVDILFSVVIKLLDIIIPICMKTHN